MLIGSLTIEVVLAKNVHIPKTGPFSVESLDAAFERLTKTKSVVTHPLNVGRDEDNILVSYGIDAISENEDDSYNVVLNNATVSENECIINARKPLVDYSDVKAVVGRSLTFVWWGA